MLKNYGVEIPFAKNSREWSAKKADIMTFWESEYKTVEVEIGEKRAVSVVSGYCHAIKRIGFEGKIRAVVRDKRLYLVKI